MPLLQDLNREHRLEKSTLHEWTEQDWIRYIAGYENNLEERKCALIESQHGVF